jgi:DNA-binding NtrC family response regulator
LTLQFINTDQAGVFHKIIETIGNGSMGVHLSGEKGLGKEAIVRLLYARSPRRGSPFVKVNCPMFSETQGSDNGPCFNPNTSRQESSRFNLVRLFYQAVLYLHSVDRMDLALQDRLLSLINRKFQSSPFSSDNPTGGLLIFSTSTRPLEACAATGSFSPALCDLLSGLSIHIPPLRHSLERIAPLVDYFLKRFVTHEGHGGLPHLSAAHMAKMKTHRWPGNLKELQEIVKTALRLNNWDLAIEMLSNSENPVDTYSTVDLSLDGVALMPDFEIKERCMLERMIERIPDPEMGLMDLVVYEEAMFHNKIR